MENLDISEEDLQNIKHRYKYYGYESNLYQASDNSFTLPNTLNNKKKNRTKIFN